MSCPRIIAALNDCQRKHPKDADVSHKSCAEHSPTLVGPPAAQPSPATCSYSRSAYPLLQPPLWSDQLRAVCFWDAAMCCVQLRLQLICAGLTAAAGWCIFKGLCPAEVRSIEDCIGISNSAGRAPVIPERCADRAALLEACLESQQELAERKTGQCGGAQPIPKTPQPAPAPAR